MMTRDLLPLTNYFATTNKIRIDYHAGSHYFVHVPLVLQNVKASCDTIVPLYLFEVVFKSVIECLSSYSYQRMLLCT